MSPRRQGHVDLQGYLRERAAVWILNEDNATVVKVTSLRRPGTGETTLLEWGGLTQSTVTGCSLALALAAPEIRDT